MAWIDEGGSVAKASDRLCCHRNTVRNRLQRIEALTGRSLTDPSDSARSMWPLSRPNSARPSTPDGWASDENRF